MWDLVPWPGIEPGPPALGVRSLSHWTTREFPLLFIKRQNHTVIKRSINSWARVLNIKITCINYLIVPVGQKSSCGLAGASGSRSAMRLQLICWSGLQSPPKARLKADFLPRSSVVVGRIQIPWAGLLSWHPGSNPSQLCDFQQVSHLSASLSSSVKWI